MSRTDYQDYAKPHLTRQLVAVGLDVAYHRAEGNTVYYWDQEGIEVDVSDFLGGYGACLFGHNHPAVLKVVQDFMDRKAPQWVQASIRSSAGTLASEINHRMHEEFGGSWLSLFGSTGAESVEIALKHTRYVWEEERRRFLTKMSTLSSQPVRINEEAADLLGIKPGHYSSLPSSAIQEIDHIKQQLKACAPIVLALEGSFHGKTKGALEVTSNEYFKLDLGTDSSGVIFLLPDPDALGDCLDRVKLTVPILQASPEGPILRIKSYFPVTCLLLEPLQGEGGILPIPEEVARVWQAQCRDHGIALVADEIQCGMSRTGSFCYSTTVGLRPDYVLLSKSMGGGLAKISVCAVRRDIHFEEFSLRHSSTFAEDELSSEVARVALQMSFDTEIQASIQNKGFELLDRLRGLAEEYPDIIREVRGKGLMVGIEFRDDIPFRSTTLSFFDREGMLGYLIAGYLLRIHRLRVAPALGNRRVLRLEPAYLVTRQEITRLVNALDRVCDALRHNRVQVLMGHILGLSSSRVDEASLQFQRKWHYDDDLTRVAFIGHFIEPEDMALWDPYLANLDKCHFRSMLETMPGGWAPHVYDQIMVQGEGRKVILQFIGLPVSSEQMLASLHGRNLEPMRDLIGKAVDLAIGNGCRVVGLGGYTSILTRNGKTQADKPILLTSGNSYTVASAYRALTTEAEEIGLSLPDATAAVLGAGGNIGSTLARLMAAQVGRLILIGRPGRLYLLDELRNTIQSCGNGIPTPEVIVTDDIHALRAANLILCASNASNPLVYPEMIRPGKVVICDVSVPGDVVAGLTKARPDVRLIRGGIIYSPNNPQFYVPGIPLPPGHLYACMTETILMGLEAMNTHCSLGEIHLDQVRLIEEAARRHHFDKVVSKMGQSY